MEAVERRASSVPVSRRVRVAGRCLLPLPLLQILPLLWLIRDRALDVPYLDEWALVDFVRRADGGTLRPADFWAFHIVHRMVVPRLVLLPLIQLTDWNRQVGMAFNVLFALGTLGVLLGCVRRTTGSTGVTIALTMPLSLLLLSYSQYENWLFPFQINFLLTVFGVVCSLWALTGPASGWRAFALAVAGALIASFSTLAGLMAWPAFLPAILRMGYRRAILWVGLAVAVIVPYTEGFPGQPTAARPPAALLGYALAYLGSPLGYPDVARAQLFAVLGIVLLVGNLLVLRPWRGEVGFVAPWLGLALFALACTALTTLGREVAGVAQALTSRYHTFAALWWVALVVVACLAIIRSAAGWRRATATRSTGRGAHLRWAGIGANAIALCLLGAGLLAANRAGFRDALGWQADLRGNRQCVLHYDGAPNSCLALYHPHPALVRAGAAYLAERRLAPFRRTTPLDVAQLAPRGGSTSFAIETVGGVTTTRQGAAPIPFSPDSPLLVTGWAADDAAGGPAGGVIVTVDGDRHFHAVYGGERADVSRRRGAGYGRSGFVAMIPAATLPPGRHQLTVKVVTSDGRSYYEAAQRVELNGVTLAPPDIDQITRSPYPTAYFIETVGETVVTGAGRGPVVVPAGKAVTVGGWAVDSAAGGPAGGVVSTVDGGRNIVAEYGGERPDVAEAFGSAAYRGSAYVATIPAAALPPGRHVLTVKIVASDRRSYYEPPQMVELEVR